MRFDSPEWFLLLPVLLLAAWWWKAGGLRQPLRLACAVLLILVLAKPEVRRLEEGLDLWVLVDQSASANEDLVPRLPELETLLEKGMAPEDRIFYVDFADEMILRGDNETQTFTGHRERTRLNSAARFALARMASDRASRLLVLSDGYSTEPFDDLAERLSDQEIPLDYRLVGEESGADYRVEHLALPQRVQSGEPFLIEVTITGQPEATVPFTLLRDGEKIVEDEVAIRQGRGRVRLAERLFQGGSHQYEIRLHPETDSHTGNNVSENWIEIAGGPRILLITGYTDDPLVPILQNQGFEVDVELNPRTLSPGRLTGARAVVINNVSADQVPPDFTEALDFFVQAQGGGFLMAGGKRSFGSGGYHGSTIDDLLPVSTELRQEQRRLAAAMAIVLDRSGSMSAGVPGGRTKMDLANEGAAQTIELLGRGDAITVFAVDSEPHPILPLTVLGDDVVPLTRTVRRIASTGGGISVYTGLAAAWKELQKPDQGQRHIILFADAADAEEPGNYKTLIAEMVNQGATVSVIGLGTEADPDAAFLRDIAERGGGRVFFNANPQELPAIFAQETVAVARSAFIEEPAPLQRSAGWLEIAARQLEWPAAIDGYNLSYLKPEATAAAFSADENEAPLVAFWQRGIGRTAAISFPLGGEFSGTVRNWDGYGDFLQTLGRWLAGDETPPGLGLRTSIDGNQLLMELLYNDEREMDVARTPPRLLISRDPAREIETLTWERMEPGRYQARLPLEPGISVRGAAQVGASAIPFGPIVLGRSPEWNFEPRRIEELKHLSRLSGGEERLDLSQTWESPRRLAFRDLQLPLLVLLLLLFLVEAAWTRLGGRWQIRRAKAAPAVPSRRPKRIARQQRAAVPETSEEKIAAPEEAPTVAAGGATELKRQSRFDRAKRRGL